MMQANPGVPPSEHLGHHRECSYRELAALLRGAFDRESWHMTIGEACLETRGLGCGGSPGARST